jgi:hypothetical protein
MRTSIFALISLSAILAAGCGKGDFPVGRTAGRVTCDGQPVAGVRVYFEPLETGGSAIVGKQGSGVTDADGRFNVSTYGAGDGAVVGRQRVRVGWADEDSRPTTPCPCEVNSEKDVMQVEVLPGEDNEFEVALVRKTRRDRPTLDELEAIEEARAEAQDD